MTRFRVSAMRPDLVVDRAMNAAGGKATATTHGIFHQQGNWLFDHELIADDEAMT
jgi:hypothetical protein